jgi:lipoprotein NlpD
MDRKSFPRQFAEFSRVWLQLCAILFYIGLSGCASGGFVSIENKFAGTTKIPKGGEYRIRQGDTLFGIALQADVDYRKLAQANNIAAPYVIYPGQKIKLKEKAVTLTESNKRPTSASTKPSNKPRLSRHQSKSVNTRLKSQATISDSSDPIRWFWPLTGRVIAKFSTKQPINKGIDIKGQLGQSVRAAAAGKVVFAGVGPRGYGQLVIIDHNRQYLSAYANNRKVLVKENDLVQARQIIAQLNAEDAQRARLHFEVRRQGKPLNPLKLLPAEG